MLIRRTSRWTGAAKLYLSFASPDTDHNIGRFYYSIELEMKGAMSETIEHKNYAVIRDIMAKKGCSIQVDFVHCDHRRYRLKSNPLVSVARQFREIHLFGTADEIASAAWELEGLRVSEEDEEEEVDEGDGDVRA
jgi:hypothetical protein